MKEYESIIVDDGVTLQWGTRWFMHVPVPRDAEEVGEVQDRCLAPPHQPSQHSYSHGCLSSSLATAIDGPQTLQMAEIFGLAAGVLQVASFGADVGSALYSCATKIRHANKQLKDLSRQVKLRQDVLAALARYWTTLRPRCSTLPSSTKIPSLYQKGATTCSWSSTRLSRSSTRAVLRCRCWRGCNGHSIVPS